MLNLEFPLVDVTIISLQLPSRSKPQAQQCRLQLGRLSSPSSGLRLPTRQDTWRLWPDNKPPISAASNHHSFNSSHCTSSDCQQGPLFSAMTLSSLLSSCHTCLLNVILMEQPNQGSHKCFVFTGHGIPTFAFHWPTPVI